MTVSGNMILINSTVALASLVLFLGVVVSSLGKGLLTCLCGKAIAGEPNQSACTALNCSLLGGVESTPINILEGRLYPCGINALLPTKLLF